MEELFRIRPDLLAQLAAQPNLAQLPAQAQNVRPVVSRPIGDLLNSQVSLGALLGSQIGGSPATLRIPIPGAPQQALPPPIQTPPVQPGDLMTSALINSILARLDALENLFRLGALGTDSHTLVALGTGFETGGGIWLDGRPLLPGEPLRGINLAILSPALALKFTGTYDTLADPAASQQLVSDLQTRASQYDVVVAVTHDAYADQLQPAAKAALAAVGGARLGQASRTRDNAAFIGVVPASLDNVSFDYFVSLIPATTTGTGGDALLAGLPLVWGVYSLPMQRFVMGGGTGGSATATAPPPTTPTIPTVTRTFPTITQTFPTITQTFPTITRTFPTITRTLQTRVFNPTLVFGGVTPEDPVTSIPGVGSAERVTLESAGINNLAALAGTDATHLAGVLNVSGDEAAGMIGLARNMIGG